MSSSAVTRTCTPAVDKSGNKSEVVIRSNSRKKKESYQILDWNEDVTKSTVGAPSTIVTSVPDSTHLPNTSVKRSSSTKHKSTAAAGNGSHFDAAGAAVLGFLGAAAGAAMAYHAIKNTKEKKKQEHDKNDTPPKLNGSHTKPTKSSVETSEIRHSQRSKSEKTPSTSKPTIMAPEVSYAHVPRGTNAISAPSDFVTVADASQSFGKLQKMDTAPVKPKASGNYSEAELDALAARLRAQRQGGQGTTASTTEREQQWQQFDKVNRASRQAEQTGQADDFRTVADASHKYGVAVGSSRHKAPKGAPLSEEELNAKAEAYMRNKNAGVCAAPVSAKATGKVSASGRLSGTARAALESLGTKDTVDDFQTVIEGGDDDERTAEAMKLAAKYGVKGGYDVDDFGPRSSSGFKSNINVPAYAHTSRGGVMSGGLADDFHTVVDGGDDYDREAEMIKLAASLGVQGGYDTGDFRPPAGASRNIPMASGIAHGGLGSIPDDFKTVVEGGESDDEREAAAAALCAQYGIANGVDSGFKTVVNAKHKSSSKSSSKSKSASSPHKPSSKHFSSKHSSSKHSLAKPIAATHEEPDDFETVIEQPVQLMKYKGKIPSDFMSTVGDDKPRGFHLGDTARPDLVDDGASEVSYRAKPNKSALKKPSRHNSKSKSPNGHSRRHSRASSVASTALSQSSKLTTRTPPTEFCSRWDSETVVPGDSISQVGR